MYIYILKVLIVSTFISLLNFDQMFIRENCLKVYPFSDRINEIFNLSGLLEKLCTVGLRVRGCMCM